MGASDVLRALQNMSFFFFRSLWPHRPPTALFLCSCTVAAGTSPPFHFHLYLDILKFVGQHVDIISS
jgi:hypothetical protein